ncbi:hypothetical protein Tsubulata_032061 [Turnera subulata]|uniref:Helicase ATP-binding domain-containing protein n=1 Tax=Turnera subulata TaxID=218843 RepID=A0A9Q0J5Y5_9ROSI|nr:hypothetical protein Tsubulata_032061 [Turnera subulata]
MVIQNRSSLSPPAMLTIAPIILDGPTKTYKLPIEISILLKEHQRRGISLLWNLHREGQGGVIGDETGTGKTRFICAYIFGLLHLKLIRRSLLVVPVTLVSFWKEEFSKVALTEETNDGVVITTYDTVAIDQDCQLLSMRTWDYLFIDEGHLATNDTTMRGKGLRNIPSQHRIAITATPLQKNVEELFAKIEPYLLRRKKDVVCPELSKKLDLIVWLKLTKCQQQQYKACCKQVRGSKNSLRFAALKMFQKDDGPEIFLLSSKVGSLGLTLTQADRVIVVDPDWNASTDDQSVDRAHRIGQEKQVITYRLITCGTVEETIYRKQIFKSGLLRIATGQEKPMTFFSQEDLEELFHLPSDEKWFSSSRTQKILSYEHEDDDGILKEQMKSFQKHMKRFQKHLNSFGELDCLVGLSRHSS